MNLESSGGYVYNKNRRTIKNIKYGPGHQSGLCYNSQSGAGYNISTFEQENNAYDNQKRKWYGDSAFSQIFFELLGARNSVVSTTKFSAPLHCSPSQGSTKETTESTNT